MTLVKKHNWFETGFKAEVQDNKREKYKMMFKIGCTSNFGK